MKLREIYERAIKKAVKEDPRPRSMVEEELKKAGNEYKKLKGIGREIFDRERLSNPYADSRILHGIGSEEIRSVLVGIDIDVQELLLADRLREKGVRVDLVVSHHPSGRAFARLDRVLTVQPGIWETLGFSKEIAQGLMKDRMAEVARSLSPRNHNRAVDAARLLDIPFMCLHTAADNCVSRFLQRTFDRENPKKLRNVMNLLMKIAEYRHAMKTGAGPRILVGEEDSVAGRIFVDMTGGTNGPDRVFVRLSQSGLRTIVGMHIKESGYKTVKAEFLNYVVAGHMASDTLGVNLLFDAIDPKGDLDFIECSGFKRVKR